MEPKTKKVENERTKNENDCIFFFHFFSFWFHAVQQYSACKVVMLEF